MTNRKVKLKVDGREAFYYNFIYIYNFFMAEQTERNRLFMAGGMRGKNGRTKERDYGNRR